MPQLSLIRQVLLPLLFVWAVIASVLVLLELLRRKSPNRICAALERAFGLDLRELGPFGNYRLILASAAGLFLELLLVRWVSAEIRMLSYFKNLVLIACFFGFGLGCYLSRRRIQMLNTILPLLGLALFFDFPWQGLHNFLLELSGYIGGLSDVHVWAREYGSNLKLYLGAGIAFSVIIPVVALVTISMIPLGQMVARYLETAPRGISAYSVNVIASLVGIWLFTGLGFLSTPPQAWFLLFGLGLLALLWPVRRMRVGIVICFIGISILFLGSDRLLEYQPRLLYGAPDAVQNLKIAEETEHWSPYQKLSLTTLTDGKEPIRYMLDTNGAWYQEILDLSPAFVKAHPQYFDAEMILPYYRYNFPYRFVDRPQKVLILGSGMGNDVAAAIRNGSQGVIAVEIDPLIQRLGRQYHFEHSYSDPSVQAVIDDARSYVQNSDERFDLVVSSILDSHVTQSSFTNIRTDNYVYTREGLSSMLQLLKPGGVLALSFSGERPWFTGRLNDLLTEITGSSPLIVQNGYTFFLVGDGIKQRLAQDPELAAFVTPRMNPPMETAAPTTDDWPYFYQRERGIPVIVLLLSAVLLLICWGVLRTCDLSLGNLHWHFFFLGAGFMLLEVQIISKVALLFGTTWLTNAIVISVLLVLILLSNVTVTRLGDYAHRVGYSGLFLILVLCYLTPMQALLFDSLVLRALVSTLFLCLPVYFAGLIFITSFAGSKFEAEAFGANLLGAVIGGLLEALSFWSGIRSLLIVAAACYLLSALLRKRVAVSTAMEAAVQAARS